MTTIPMAPPSLIDKGGFLPDTFLEEVDRFLEDDDDEEEEMSSHKDTECTQDDEDDQDESQAQDDENADTKERLPFEQSSPTLVSQLSVEAVNLAAKSSIRIPFAQPETKQHQDNHLPPPAAQPKKSVSKKSSSSNGLKELTPPQVIPKKSALKKTSSYNGLNDLDDDNEILINTDKRVWNTLPVPNIPSKGVRRAGSSPALFPDTPSPPEQAPLKHNVSFHKITIRDYSMTVSDNPSCFLGTPVGLDWEYHQQSDLQLDVYEKNRRPERRSRADMRLDAWQRQVILRDAGVSHGEMVKVQRQVHKVRRQRAATMTFLPLERMESLIQSATRKMKRLGLGGKKTKMKRSRSANSFYQEESSSRFTL